MLAALLLAPAAALASVWLQIDAGGHSAPVMRLAVDAARDRVVTASDDKTARLWSLSEGRPIAVLRPPVGPGRVGRLFGAAFDPAGERVAVAGSGSVDHAPGPSIWVYDAASARFLQRIDARGEHVRRLAWTPDGRLLVACYEDPGMLRAFDATDGSLAFEVALGGNCQALSARAQRVAAGSRDGTLHVFRQQGRTVEPVARHRLDADPFAVDLAPDGARVAVGYFTAGAGAAVLRTDDGTRLLRLRTSSDVERRVRTEDPISRTQAIAWSADGRAVWAAGLVDTPQRTEGRVRAFDAESGRLLVDHAAAEDAVLDLAALPAGGPEAVAWASFAGTWGTASVAGVQVRAAPRVAFLVRRGAAELLLSGDARQVRWLRGAQREPVSFDARSRALGGDAAGLRPPATALDGTDERATSFVNHFEPRVRGERVPMSAREVSRALAYVGRDGDVVLATDLGLRRLDRSLRTVWEVKTATEVRAVNASADGTLVVSTLSDGTVRWWRAADGALLLTLLATRDGWVAWTPTGHYDAGPGGESLIGWLVDRPDASVPDWFGIGRFRERFHRPDVIDRVLDARDPAEALRLADAQRANATGLAAVAAPPPAPPAAASVPAAPPSVAVATTSGAAVDEIRPPVPIDPPPVLAPLEPLRIVPPQAPRTFRFTVRLADAPQPLRIEARLDGRRVQPQRVALPARPDGTTPAEVTLAVDPAVRIVQLVARSGERVSEPLRFLVDGDPVAALEPAVADGTLHVLSIGVARYADRGLDLVLAAKDARDFAAAMLRQRGLLYREVSVRTLVDNEATATSIRRALDELPQRVGERDAAVVFLAGHGFNDASGRFVFAAHDFERSALRRGAIDAAALVDTLASLRGRGLLFLDTCFAGAVPELLKGVSRDTARLANELSAAENAVSVFASSTGQQESFENPRWGNGAFTRAIVDGLGGAARLQQRPVVTMRSLSPFVTDGVARLTAGRQTPVSLIPDGMPDRILSSLDAPASR
jgi:WD40 repeat protein